MIGKTLGHYEILSELGRGGMGEVYRARDTKLGREVAIKVLPAEFSQDEERLARLEREARMLAALNHPNIAAIYGLEQSDNTRFLVLELVEGDTLADRLKGGALPVEESLKLALQIAEALEAAHEKGVIHRDLKPANIKITPQGRVKVLDFGLAKAFIGDQADVNLSNSPTLSMAATRAGIILGTAAYMSPEQAGGEVADHRTDVWAFGVVLFEMLSGRQLFTGRTASHVMGAVLERTPDWSQLPPNLHPRIRFLLERCLEKEARQRCQTILEARLEIEKVLTDRDRAPVPAVTRDVPSPKSLKLGWIAALVAGVVIGSVLVWALTSSSPPAPGIVTRFGQELPEGSAFRATGRDTVAISPDSRHFVYNTSAGLVLRSMNAGEPRVIPGTEEGFLTNPFFSPDSQWIAYWDGPSSQLRKIPVGGGASITLTAADNPQGASWASDGTILFGQAEGIMRVSDDGGEPDLVVSAGEGEQLWDPQLLPDGRVLLTAWPGGPTGEITVATPGTDDRTTLFPGERAVYVPTGHLVVTDPLASPNALLARSFDLATLEFGGAVPMEEGVAFTTGKTHFSVSRSGSLVYSVGFSTGGGVQDRILAIVDAEGRISEQIDAAPAPYLSPRISPDGRFLAVQINGSDGTSDIWIKSLADDSRIRRLTIDGQSSRPVWTPDSTRVTFTSVRDDVPGIFWQPIAGGAAERLTETEGAGQHWPESWSPDGKTLAFTEVPPSGAIIDQLPRVYEVDTGETMELPVLPSSGGMVFSPDGLWFAYHATASGGVAVPSQIYVQPYPPSGADVSVTPDGGTYAVFSPDGHLTYRRPALVQAAVDASNASPTEVVSIDLNLEGGITFGEESILNLPGMASVFGYRDFDPTPDGHLVIALYPDQPEFEEAASPKINVVLNWVEELKERVPVP